MDDICNRYVIEEKVILELKVVILVLKDTNKANLVY